MVETTPVKDVPAGAIPPAMAALTLDDYRLHVIASLEAFAYAIDPWYRDNFEAPQRALCRALTDYRRGRNVTLPDGTALDAKSFDFFACWMSRDTVKSGIMCELFPAWLALYWVFERKMQPSIYLFQATLDKAKLHLSKIKRIMCGEVYATLFHMIVPRHRDPEKWGTMEAFDLVNLDVTGKREHTYQVASVGSSFTGHHPTDVVVDDAETEENYASEADQVRIFNSLQLQDNLPDTKFGRRYFVGTPYGPVGVNNRIMSGEMGRALNFTVPAFTEPPDLFFRWANPRTSDEERAELAKVLSQHYTLGFPGRLDFTTLARKFRGQGSKFFSSQQLLLATDSKSAVFRAEWFEAALVTADEARKRVTGRPALLVDSAWKRPQNRGLGDDTAMGVVDWDKDGDPYLLDLFVSDTVTEAAGMDQMSRMVNRWKCARVLKETFGEDGFSVRWRDYCKSHGVRYVPCLKPDRPSSAIGKENRIRQLAAPFEMGEYFVVDSLPYLDILRRQFTQYSGEGSGKDDILDMLADSIMTEVKPGRVDGDGSRVWQQAYRQAEQVSTSMLAAGRHAEQGSIWASMKGRF